SEPVPGDPGAVRGARVAPRAARANDGFGAVVQSVRAPACHAGSCGLESRPPRHSQMPGTPRARVCQSARTLLERFAGSAISASAGCLCAPTGNQQKGIMRKTAIGLSLVSGGCVLACSTPVVRPVDVQPVTPGAGETLVVNHSILIIDSSGSISRRDQFPHE